MIAQAAPGRRILAAMRFLLGLMLAGLCFGQGEAEYVFGFLRAAPARADLPKEQLAEIQKGHMAHLGRMAKDGILMAAGPLGDADLRGIVIFKGVTVGEAKRAAAGDPAVAAGRLWLDAAQWRGPAGIGEKLAAQMKEKPDAQVAMTKRAFILYRRTAALEAAGEAERKAAWEAHRVFARREQDSGKLLAAGELRGSKEFAGVLVFRAEEAAAALELCRTQDPLVQRGWVEPRALVWYVAEETFARP